MVLTHLLHSVGLSTGKYLHKGTVKVMRSLSIILELCERKYYEVG